MADNIKLRFLEDLTFENRVMHLTGHAYVNCTFRKCTIVFRGFPTKCDHVHFEDCVWEINWLVHDRNQWEVFLEKLGPSLIGSVPQ